MDVSSSTAGSANSSTQVEALKKAIDVQEKSVLKVLDSANEQAKQVTAQKTGVGNNLNLTA
ncbi:MAG: hypothetical protein Q7S59_04895 [Sulfurimonas sp.]|jgi:hypothetical protein|nr:hypothetical protein [Sulfurimonas sp.]